MPSFNGLVYEVRGAGQPIVFLHAGISDMGMWDDQTAYFSGQYQVIRYDLRGCGKSPIIPGEISHVEDLDALLTHLNLASVVLVGCSMGGTTALDYTLAHPDKVKALVLVGADPSGYELQGEPPQALLKMQEALQNQNLPDALEYAAQLWVDGEGRTPDQVDSALRDRVKQTVLIMFQNYGV
ncbi:MAG: alpha/beta hydrolase, partial [Anaerolineae bacterium]|nr:alpha/beta hydrolase [Anaerolineae bacterium]